MFPRGQAWFEPAGDPPGPGGRPHGRRMRSDISLERISAETWQLHRSYGFTILALRFTSGHGTRSIRHGCGLPPGTVLDLCTTGTLYLRAWRWICTPRIRNTTTPRVNVFIFKKTWFTMDYVTKIKPSKYSTWNIGLIQIQQKKKRNDTCWLLTLQTNIGCQGQFGSLA